VEEKERAGFLFAGAFVLLALFWVQAVIIVLKMVTEFPVTSWNGDLPR